jgi:hypothetical protein
VATLFFVPVVFSLVRGKKGEKVVTEKKKEASSAEMVVQH